MPVPESVAKIHQHVFEPTAAAAKVGKLLCLVTLHDAPLRRGQFYSLALFANGSVATWRQTPRGGEEPFIAKLSSSEQVRASDLLEAIPAGRALAREKFDASAVVMGVSARAGERVETLYFDNDRVPAALGDLVAILKQRLEATNQSP